MDIAYALGLPAATTTAIIGIFVWLFKKYLHKREEAKEEKEKNMEQLILLTLHNTRATNILATATAKAIQRIPDAHCNGDMTEALEQAAIIQKQEKDFLFNQGVKHIFGEQ